MTGRERVAIWACILIGGKSSRMGRPKHLLLEETTTWLEKSVGLLAGKVDGIVLVGGGEVPPTLAHLPRLADADGAEGPLGGVLAAMRSRPHVDWLVLACDMPAVTAEAVEWLLAGRSPADLARVPVLPNRDRGEPLFALYGAGCLAHFEELLRRGEFRLRAICGCAGVREVVVPEEIAAAWRNVNTPEELRDYRRETHP